MVATARPKILVTRPQPGAAQTAKRLDNHNFETLVLPFTEMVWLPHQLDDEALKQADGVVVTSANALRYVDDELVKEIKNLPIYAVGDATRGAAIDKGFNNVISANGDARDLIKLVASELKPSASIIYLCGETRTNDIELQLGELGFTISISETYRTKKVSQLTYELSKLIQRQSIDGVLLYSSISARIFGEYWSGNPIANSSVIPTIFCISERTKLALTPDLRKHAIVCSQPRDDVLIETVRSYYQSKNREL